MSDPFEDIPVTQRRQEEDDPFADIPGKDGQPVNFDLMTAVGNIPSSALGVAKDFYDAATSPVETAKAIGNIGKGLVSKGMRVHGAAMTGQPYGQVPEILDESAADAAGQFYKDRYGSMDAIKTTAMEDPAGMMLDVASVVPGAATARVPQAAKTFGAMARNPLGPSVAKNALKALDPESMYQSSAKFSTSPNVMPGAKRERIINEALDRGILPTDKGVAKIDSLISGLDGQLEAIIGEAGNAGKVIPVGAVFSKLKQLRQQKGGFKLESEADLAKIDEIAKAFHESLDGRQTVTPAELQAFKRDAYAKINFDRRQGTANQTVEDTRKAMARGAREALEGVDPDIGPINREMAPLLDLQPHLERASRRIGNLNPVGLTDALGGGLGASVGGALGGAPGAAIGALAGLGISWANSPIPKARAAIILRKLRAGDTDFLEKLPAEQLEFVMVNADRIQDEMERDGVNPPFKRQ